MNKDAEICQTCQGSGQCPSCNGTGSLTSGVKVPGPTTNPERAGTVRQVDAEGKTCATCSGTGSCQKCHGAGNFTL